MSIVSSIRSIYGHARSCMLLGGILLMAHIAPAQSWTHVASACVPDESSTGLYQFDNGTVSFGPNTRPNSKIKLRCNVTSPLDFTAGGTPAWAQLEVGYQNPVGGQITVQLVQINQTNGTYLVKSTFVSPAGGPALGVAPIAGIFDFQNFAYYVVINLNRPEGASPKVWYVGTK